MFMELGDQQEGLDSGGAGILQGGDPSVLVGGSLACFSVVIVVIWSSLGSPPCR